MKSRSVVLLFSILAAASGCSDGSPSPAPIAHVASALELEPTEIPARSSAILHRVTGVDPAPSPWAKIELPEPGLVVFDGLEGHPLLDVPSQGMSFADSDELATYMIEHFKAIKTVDPNGRLGFTLRVITIGNVGFAENATQESVTFTEVRDPVLTLLGGKEGSIHLLDKPAVPTSFGITANCGTSRLRHEGNSLSFKVCSAYVNPALPGLFMPPFHMTVGSTKFDPPSNGDQNGYVYSGCGGGGGMGSCVPQFSPSPTQQPNRTAPNVAMDTRGKWNSGYIQNRFAKKTYWATSSVLTTSPSDIETFKACTRHDLQGTDEKWDLISYPSQFDIKSAKVCLAPWP